MEKVDLNKVSVRKVNGVHGFLHMGHTYIHIKDVTKILKLSNTYGFNWSRIHELFYNSMRLLRINPEDYPVPLNHVPASKPGPISDNERDLPEWVMDDILTKMAQSKIKDYVYTNYIDSLKYAFNDITNIINDENKLQQDSAYLTKKGEYQLMNLNNENMVQQDGPNMVQQDRTYSNIKMQELGIDLQVCANGENPIKGFVKNGDIHLNSKDAAFMIGLYKEESNGTLKIRWDNFYKSFKKHCIFFGYDSNHNGFDFRDPSNKAGFSSKYEVMVPEYIPYKIVFMMANELHNFHACKFRFDIMFTILPFFIDNAPMNEINKVSYLQNLAPLIANYKDNYPQFFNQSPQLCMVYPNQSIQFNPAIPGYWNNPNVSKPMIAYKFPPAKDIQKNLDAQKSPSGRPLKTVVYFVDKNEED